MLDPSLFEDNKTDGGITYTKQKDGSIIINGTLEKGKNSTFQLGDYIDSLEDGKHYIYKSDSDAGVLNIGYNDGTPNDYRNDVTVDKKRMAYIKCYVQFNQKYPPQKTHLFPMLNEGTVVKPFEPYTGGKTSPSPEIPAEIINKGSVMTTGKQLWDNEAAMNMDFWLGKSTAYKHANLNLKPNTTYTLSVDQNNMHKNYKPEYAGNFAFYIGETEDAANPNKLFGNSGSSFTNVLTKHTFRTSDKPFYFNLYVGNSWSNDEYLKIAFTELLQNIMLVEGDQVLPWEPFTNGQQIVNPYAGKINLNVTGKNLLKPNLYYTYYEFPLKANTVMTLMTNGKPSQGGNIKFSATDGSIVWFAIDAGQTRVCRSIGNKDVKGFYNALNVGDGLEYMFSVGDIKNYTPYIDPQSLTVSTPNGLPGIPVKTDGNYTDSNGQQWVCDEIDYGHKKYVQRIKIDQVTLKKDLYPLTAAGYRYTKNNFNDTHPNYKEVLSDKFMYHSNAGETVNGVTVEGIRMSPSYYTLVAFYKSDQPEESVETTIFYILENPIKRDLTPEEISAYESIVTHNDTTVISNNENCNMKITYTKGVLMPKYDSTKLIVQMKALARTESMPIDSTEVWDSLAEAQSYVKEANAYAGQTIKALVNGKYKTYTLQPSGGGYTLEEVGAISQSDLKQYVQVVERLPESGQQQGVIYIVGTTGQIWTGSAWKVVFKEVSAQVDQLTSKVTKLEGDLAKKAPINNPVFTGKVMVGSDEVAVKSYVDGLISNLVSSAPGVVDGDHPLPVDGYKAGQTWRVALAGTYAGQKCEVGDLIICIKDFNTQTNNSDFMVVQANVDGAVTSTATTSTVGEIVVFNAATGKVIKGSGVNISSLNDVISKAHTHANKTILDSYDKDQTQLLADAAATAQSKVDALKTEVNKKANKATTLAGYGITDAYTEAEIDAKLKTITDNVNTKVDAATVDSKIDTAKGEIETAYNKAITEKLAARVGSIPEDTDIKTYVDTAIGSGGTASAEAIAKAKQEAINASKQYTDSQLQVTEF